MAFTRQKYTIEDHPFETFVPFRAKQLIIGTFPTFRDNFRFNFYYSGKENAFWEIIEQVYKYRFQHNTGEQAVIERKSFLAAHLIGMTDMHNKCYRVNSFSSDESLFSITLRDIFQILDEHTCIEKIIFTSRTDVFGALGLFKTYCLQQNHNLGTFSKRPNKIVEGVLERKNRRYKILVPYSPSPRVLKEVATLQELVAMYKECLE